MPKSTPIARLPFAFWLEDRLERSAVYMVDTDKQLEQRLNLYIENREEQTLFFGPTDLDRNPPTADNCHFELRFRRGVLADASLAKSSMKGQEGRSVELLLTGKYQKRAYELGSWVISAPDDHVGQTPYVSFYLARAEKGAGGRFLPQERQRLVLTNVSANPDGASSETRVELIPRKLYYDPPPQADARPVTEAREQNVLVVNQLGKEHIPLHIAFIGPYTVRNDGEVQGAGHQLRLRLTNTSPHDTIRFTKKSRLLFAFDYAEGDQDEELGKAGNVSTIKFYVDEAIAEKALLTHGQMAENPIWEFNDDRQLSARVMAPGKHLDILLDTSLFATGSLAGLTPLTITYENVPGYWDGKLYTAVEKTPLPVRVITQDGKEMVEVASGRRPLHLPGETHLMGRVGIGTATPEEQLHIVGGVRADGDVRVSGESTLLGNVHIGDQTQHAHLSVTGRIKDKTGDVMPVGAIIAYGGTTPPPGWLLCDGSSIAWYDGFADLRGIVGNNVPDLLSRFIVGAGQGNGLSNYGIGVTGGTEFVQLNVNQMPTHRHGFLTSGTEEDGWIGEWEVKNRTWHFKMTDRVKKEGGIAEEDNGSMNIPWQLNETDLRPQSIKPTGGNQSHENRPPYYALTYIIKY
ncbi:MAG: tail fiber protein [Spirosoma sp.]|nr:tail fiber protein [Spirosoma sp.]